MTTNIDKSKLLDLDEIEYYASVSENEYEGLYSSEYTTEQMKEEFTYRIEGNDLVITTDEGIEICVEGYYEKNGESKFNLIAGNDFIEEGAADIIEAGLVINRNKITQNSIKYEVIDTETKDVVYPETITDKNFSDFVDLRGFTEEEDVSPVSAGKGNDVIIGSSFDDTISGGVGKNTLTMDLSDNTEFGDDTYQFTEGEEFNVRLAYSVENQYKAEVAENEEDIELTVYGKSVYSCAKLTVNTCYETYEGSGVYTITYTLTLGNKDGSGYTGSSINGSATKYSSYAPGDIRYVELQFDKNGELVYESSSWNNIDIYDGGEHIGKVYGNSVADPEVILGTVTLKGLALADVTTGITVDGDPIIINFDKNDVEQIQNPIVDEEGQETGDVEIVNTLTSTAINDDINLVDFESEHGGVTINTFDGDDSVVGSNYDDEITTGSGYNTISVDFKNGKFGDDTINLTEDEKLTISVNDSNTWSYYEYEHNHQVDRGQIETFVNDSNVVINTYAKALIDYDKESFKYYEGEAERKLYTKTVNSASSQLNILEIHVNVGDNGKITSGSFIDEDGNPVPIDNTYDHLDELNKYTYEKGEGQTYRVNASLSHVLGIYTISVPSGSGFHEKSSTGGLNYGSYYVSSTTDSTFNATAETPAWEVTNVAYNYNNSSSDASAETRATLQGKLVYQTDTNMTGAPEDYNQLYYLKEAYYYDYDKLDSTTTDVDWAQRELPYSYYAMLEIEDGAVVGEFVDKYTKTIENAATGEITHLYSFDELNDTAEYMYHKYSVTDYDFKIENTDATAMGTMTVVGAAEQGALSDGTFLTLDLDSGSVLSYNYDAFNKEVIYAKDLTTGEEVVIGTNLGDIINLSDKIVSEEVPGYTINAGEGNDYIIGSAGNDKISAGLGTDNVISYSARQNNKFGDDVVKITASEITDVTIDQNFEDQVEYLRDGDNIEATVYGNTVYNCAKVVILGSTPIEDSSYYTITYNLYKGKPDGTFDETSYVYSENQTTQKSSYYTTGTHYVELQYDSQGILQYESTYWGDRNNYELNGEVYGETLLDDELVLGTITFEGALKEDLSGINGISVNGTSLGKLPLDSVYVDDANPEFTGTWVDDDIVVGNVSETGLLTPVTKSVTVDAGEGDNVIHLHTAEGVKSTIIAGSGDDYVENGEGNETFNLGDGENTLYVDASKFIGSDTIKIDKEKLDHIVFDNDLKDQIECELNYNTGNYEITVYGQNDGNVDKSKTFGKITITGLPKTEEFTIGDKGITVVGDNIVESNIKDIMYTYYVNNKNTKFRTTQFKNDYVIAEEGTKKSLNVRLGGGMNVADLSASTGKNTIIARESSVNIVTGGSGKDIYKLDSSESDIIINNVNNTINDDVELQKFGNDVVNLTKGSNTNVVFEDDFDLQYKVVGKNVKVTNVTASEYEYTTAEKAKFNYNGQITYMKTVTTIDRIGEEGNYTYKEYTTTFRTIAGPNNTVGWHQEDKDWEYTTEDLYNNYIAAKTNAEQGNYDDIVKYYSIERYVGDDFDTGIIGAEKLKYVAENAYYNTVDTLKYDYTKSSQEYTRYEWTGNKYQVANDYEPEHVYSDTESEFITRYKYTANGKETNWTTDDDAFKEIEDDTQSLYILETGSQNLGSITFKNLAAKDVLGENGSVIVAGVDLETYDYVSTAWAKEGSKTKSFTGSRLNDVVDATNFTVKKSKTTAKTKGVTIKAGDGENEITGSKYADTIKAGKNDDYVTATTGNDKYTLGAGNNEVTYSGKFDSDTFTLSKGEELDLCFAKDTNLSYARKGNDIIVTATKGNDELGTITLKNLAKGKTGAEVWLYVDGVGYSKLFNQDIEYVAKKAKKHTFVQTYDDGYKFGNVNISSNEGAKDVIRISASDKSLEKITAYDFDYSYKNNTLSMDGYNDINYTAYSKDGLATDNLAKLTFKDAEGTSWKFAQTSELTGLKTNNIAFASDIILDSEKNDIIIGSDDDDSFNYTKGKDFYSGGEGNDIYTTALDKDTNLIIRETTDNEGNYEANAIDLTTLSDVTVFFNINADGEISDETSLAIIDRESFLNGAAAASLIDGDYISESTKGTIILRDYFQAYQDEFEEVSDEDGNYYGDGYIDTVYQGNGIISLKECVENTASEVAAWLADHRNYTDAIDVIRSGNETDIQALMNVYNTVNYTPAEPV